MGIEFKFCEMKSILEVGRTTVNILQSTGLCTEEIIKMVNFIYLFI